MRPLTSIGKMDQTCGYSQKFLMRGGQQNLSVMDALADVRTIKSTD